jgi:hypothetical protein
MLSGETSDIPVKVASSLMIFWHDNLVPCLSIQTGGAPNGRQGSAITRAQHAQSYDIHVEQTGHGEVALGFRKFPLEIFSVRDPSGPRRFRSAVRNFNSGPHARKSHQ